MANLCRAWVLLEFNAMLAIVLQLIAVPKARTEKLPFWADFDLRDRFAHNSLGFARIELKHS
jgi:hypothetical protein